MASGTGSPCGACKFLRRKCTADCVFAPYFCTEQGPSRFAAIHKVFGASNVSKLLLHIPVPDRCEAVVTIAYEAQARIKDPVYGCVSHIIALQQQVAFLQAQVMQAKAQMAQNFVDSRNVDSQWPPSHMSGNAAFHQAAYPTTNMMNTISPQSLLDSINDHNNNNNKNDASHMQEMMMMMQRGDQFNFQPYSNKKRPSQTDLSELQALALRMMKD